MVDEVEMKGIDLSEKWGGKRGWMWANDGVPLVSKGRKFANSQSQNFMP